MPEVLFLCTGNSCRSQMAEGFARALWPDGWTAESAGIESHGLSARAVRVMNEIGIDISGQRSKALADLPADFRPDWVVTVCSHAHETCPVFPGATTVIHQGFDDPPRLAEAMDEEAERLAVYRRVRDEIRLFVDRLPRRLSAPSL